MIDISVWEWPQYAVAAWFVWVFTAATAINSVYEFNRSEPSAAIGTVLGKLVARLLMAFVIVYGGFFN